jgi:hypothetical protein
MRSVLPLLLLVATTGALAQTPPTGGLSDREATQLDRRTQKIENIRVEDGGAVVDEVRVGGQTQSITVQPKADVPAYEIQPTDGARARASGNREGASGGSGARVWNVFKF